MNPALKAELEQISGWAIPEHDILEWLLGKLLLVDLADLGVSVRFVNQRLGTDLKHWPKKWIAYHPWMRQEEYPVGDTATEAIIGLCVYLFQQNILTKEQV